MLEIKIPEEVVEKYIKARKLHIEGDSCALRVRERIQRCNDFMTAKMELEFYLYSALEEKL